MSEATQWLNSCGGFLWAVGWKATLLLAAAWVVDRAWLRRRPLTADVMWTAALLGLLALPLGAAALPRVTLPIWQAEPAEIESRGDQGQSANDSILMERDQGVAIYLNDASAMESTSQSQVKPIDAGRVERVAWPSGTATTAALYLVVCGLLLCRLSWGVAMAARHVSRAAPIEDGRWSNALARLKEQLGVRGEVRLLASDAGAAPFMVGWRRPAIIVSADVAAAADDAIIDATLLHELTHIARSDYPIHFVGKLVEALYWWNPLAWLATARISAVRESICDGHCCWRMGSCERYGEVLLAIAGSVTRRHAAGVGLAMARGSRLQARLVNLSASGLVDHSCRRHVRAVWPVIVVALSLLSNTVVLGYRTAEDVTVAEIVAALEEVEKSIQGLSGELHLIAKYNFVKPGQNLPPNTLEDDAASSTAVGDFLFDCRFDGSGTIEADLSRTNMKSDGTKVVRRLKIASLFDGTRGKYIETLLTENGAEVHTAARYPTSFMQPNLDPLNLTTLHIGKKISGLLVDGGAKILRTEVVDGRPTVVVEVEPKTVREDYIYQQRFWIDVERRVAVRRESVVQRGKGMPWALHYRVHCHDYDEVEPRIWLPKTIRIWNYHVETDGQRYLTAMDRIDVKTWKVNESLTKIRIDDPSANQSAESAQDTSAVRVGLQETTPREPASRQLKVIVVNETGEPIADAQVFQNHVHRLPGAPANGKQTNIKNKHYRTNAAGEATLSWEGETVDLRVWARHPGRVPLHAMWSTDFQSDGGKIPDEFRFVLKPGTTIGGVVQDATGRPIAGAKVEIYNIRAAVTYAMTPAGSKGPGVRPVPVLWLAEGDAAVVTDDKGRWQATNIPSDEDFDLSKIGIGMRLSPKVQTYPLRVRISHNDFVPYDGFRDETLEGAPSLTELRTGEAVVVLSAKNQAGEDEADDSSGGSGFAEPAKTVGNGKQ